MNITTWSYERSRDAYRQERKVALDAIFSLVDGRVPVAVGYSGPTTSVVIRRMKAAPQLGARAATISVPMLTSDLEEILAAVRAAINEDRRKAAAELFDHYLPLILSEGQPKIGLGIRKEILKRRAALPSNMTRGPASIDKPTSEDLDHILERVGIKPGPRLGKSQLDSGLQGGRVAVGRASGGPARAIAESLDSEGCDPLLWARGPDGLGGGASDPTSRYGVRTECVPEGAGHKDAAQSIAIAAVNFFRAVDILVPKAGGPPPASPTATAPSVWRMAFRLFCITPVKSATRLLPATPASRWGRIVAVLSSGVRQLNDDLAYSNATWSALAAWGKDGSARVSQDGVTINGIPPEP